MKIVNERTKEDPNLMRLTTVTFGTAFKLIEVPGYWPDYVRRGDPMKNTFVLSDTYWPDDSDKGLIVNLENGHAQGLDFAQVVRILPDTRVTTGDPNEN